jgi:hypothetical protein
MSTPDTLTFLSSPDTIGAKTHYADGSTSDYDIPLGPFQAAQMPYTGLADLADILAACPFNAYHVRGTPTSSTIPYRRTKAQRNKYTGAHEPPTLTAAAHRAIPVDFDTPKNSTDLPMEDLYTAALQARAQLPAPFTDAACIALATSNAGILPGRRVRLWFYSTTREVTDQELKQLLADYPVDLSIYGGHQPIYCAPPRFEPPRVDPFPRRITVLPGADLVLPEYTTAPEQLPALPSPPDHVLFGLEHTSAIIQGNRDNTLTSIAGAMRARGLDAPAILAALELHNAAHVVPPLPPEDLSRIASSVASYEPTAVPVILPRHDAQAEREANRQAKRLAEDPGLLLDVATRLRQHIASGALSEQQALSKLTTALHKADAFLPVDQIRNALRTAPALANATAQADWQVDLIRSAEGSIRPGPFNQKVILTKSPDFSFWYDTRSDEAQIERCPWNPHPHTLTESDGVELKAWFDSQMGWPKIPLDPFDAIRHAGRARPWDPWKQGYLETLTWDQQPRLLHAAAALLGAKSKREAITFAWWMISACARTYQPGCQVDYLIVLEGPQGAGKSSFLQALVSHPRYYSRIATSGDLNNPRTTGRLQGPVVIELAEIASLTKRDTEVTKEFIDCREDKWQPLYSRTMRVSPRTVVFAGTTDRRDYLQDAAGGRRFWPIDVAHINLPLLIQHRDQIWAEALTYYKSGTQWWPTPAQIAELGLKAAQEERREQEVGEDDFLALIARTLVPGVSIMGRPSAEPWQLDYHGRLKACTAAWLRDALGLGQRDTRAITKTLTAHGWQKMHVRPFSGAAQQRVWYAPGHAPEDT